MKCPLGILMLLVLWSLVAGCTSSPSIVTPSTALPTETPVSPTPSLAPSATPKPTYFVPAPQNVATPVTRQATPEPGLTGQIAVLLSSSLALIDLKGGSPKFMGPRLPTYTQYSWAPDGSKLAYLLQADLWVLDVETQHSWNLSSTNDRWELLPRWSPDGQRIAFTSRLLELEEYGRTEIAMHGVFGGQLTVIGADGSDYQVLDKETILYTSSWSPDSRRLIYASSEGKLYIFDLKSGQRQPLSLADYGLQEDLYIYGADWSPKGNEIALSFSTRPKPEDMSVEQGCAVLNLKNHTLKILKRYNATLGLPYEGVPPGETLCCLGPDVLWSPSGNYILVNVKAMPRTQVPTGLSVIDAQGKREIRLTEKEWGAYSADWSPDGKWVVYIDNGDRSLWVINPFNPTEKYQIMGEFCCEGPVAWRPK